MPEFFAAIQSGHELKSLSALFEYLGASLVLTMPSDVVLGVWPGFQWRQTGVGPSFPSLDSIVRLGVNLNQFEIVMNALYILHDENPPMFLKHEDLRKTLGGFMYAHIYMWQWRCATSRYACARSHTHTHTHARTHIPSLASLLLLSCSLTPTTLMMMILLLFLQSQRQSPLPLTPTVLSSRCR
jgi:hypothetical protein